jgi:short-subunit dehydrogenase
MTTSRGLALITGATAGLGAEFARQLAAKGYDLVLVARDLARLEQTASTLQAQHGVRVEVLSADLLTAAGLKAVEQRVSSVTDPVTLLVNNAGYGLRGSFEQNTIDQEARLLDILVTVPMRLTHAALSQMLPKKAGTILNVASVAGFSPHQTYGASKAWLVSFTRWAHVYYERRGVRVSAVAPGFVHTEFHARMDAPTDRVPKFLWLDAPFVVRVALRDLERGKAISVPSARYKVLAWLTRALPAQLVAWGANRPW